VEERLLLRESYQEQENATLALLVSMCKRTSRRKMEGAKKKGCGVTFLQSALPLSLFVRVVSCFDKQMVGLLRVWFFNNMRTSCEHFSVALSSLKIFFRSSHSQIRGQTCVGGIFWSWVTGADVQD